ncbi:MAG TPA: DUF2520 domain-containing protein [Mycobacteriales bacterium]|nr:DUF2520 domain-containing protein [Mycobacteriales bacterium]
MSNRLRVGVIGTGRVGAVLGAALARAGHRIVAVSAVSPASLARADRLLPGIPIVAPDEVPRDADLILLAVPDGELAGLVDGLARTGALRAGQFLVHTSGQHGLAVLGAAVQYGALPLALHPALPFTGTELDLDRLVGAAFGVTAPDVLRPAAEALVLEMGGEPVWLTEDQRPLWHAALAHAANHLVTHVAEVSDVLRSLDVAEPERVLAPLLRAALDSALAQGDGALTGPVARGDADTVARHLAVLAELAPQLLPSYLALSRLSADRAVASGRLDVERAGALLKVLGSVTP